MLVPLLQLALTEDEAINLAHSLSCVLTSGDCIALFGELGAGKSTFARAMIQQLSGEEEVPSPTFTLLQQYHTPIGVLSHYDLYRVKHVNELAELAIDDALQQGVCLIEWPEVALPLLPSDCLEIRIASTKDEKTRHFEVKGSPRWQRRWLYKTTT